MVTCHICENTNKGKGETITYCVFCGTDLVNPVNETVKKKTSDVIYKRFGQLVITNKRLLFVRYPHTAVVDAGLLGGLLGEAIAGKMTDVDAKKGKMLGISLTPDTLASAEIVKHGLFGKALLIQCKDNSQYKLLNINKNQIDEWKDAIIQFSESQV